MPWLVPGSPSGLESAEGLYRAVPAPLPGGHQAPRPVDVPVLGARSRRSSSWVRAPSSGGGRPARGRSRPAAAWVIANAIEVVGKGVLTKPDVYG